MEFSMIIRPEQTEEQAGIYIVNSQAFYRPERPGSVPEAELVDRLRSAQAVILSLVAVEDQQIIGHILFSKGNIHAEKGLIPTVGLAPMAVLPEFQNKGVGSQLIAEGIEQLRKAGHERICVLGHPGYYPRFGFLPAHSTYNVTCEYDVPDEVFMALELQPGAFDKVAGVFHYHLEFRGV
jgi:putative acetyltransferase